MRLLGAQLWCPPGGVGTRVTDDTVAESLVARRKTRKRAVCYALSDEYASDSARVERSTSIVDELVEY